MTYDFIVIGTGIAGASIAYELARSARVCVLEQESRPGVHSTGRSAALLSLSYGAPPVRALTRASAAFFRDPPAGFVERELLEPRGQIFLGRPEQQARIETISATMQAAGGRSRMLDAEAARAMITLLRPGYAATSVMDPDAADIDVDLLHQGYLRGARSRGARFIYDARALMIVRTDGLWHVALPTGEISAPVLVNAAGAWADEFAVACGAAPLGLAILRRTAILVDPPEGVDVARWPAVMDPDEQFYFKPDAGKLLLSAADETPDVPCDTQPEDLDVAIAVDRVQGPLGLEIRRVTHRWAGLRTFARDRLPVIGFDEATDGLFWCAGLGGVGIHTAPAVSQLAAALLCGESMPSGQTAEGLTTEDFSPLRSGARAPERQTAG